MAVTLRSKVLLVLLAIGVGLGAWLALGAGETANADGKQVAEAAMFDTSGNQIGSVRFFRRDDGKVGIRVAVGDQSPGWHGLHIHTTGTCDPAATDPNGATVPFFSAGGHFNPVVGSTHGAHAGDTPALLVAADGEARSFFVTDRFKMRDLYDSDGSAVILHAGPDNLAHIPAAAPTPAASPAPRYHSHTEDVYGADSASKATGDAGSRLACGLVARG